MIRLMTALSFCLLPAIVLGQAPGQSPATPTNEQKASYIIGFDVASNLVKQGLKPDVEAMMQGVADALAGKDSRYSEEETRLIMTAVQQALAAKEKLRMEDLQKQNATFLAENQKKEGVVVTKSGLQYKVVKQGTGKKPAATDNVTVHYEGKLIDGTVFDSSKKRGEPATFPLNRVIAGWTEGLQLMPEGSTYIFYIPGNLAYGQNPPPGSGIYPNAVLIFEVELLKVGK